MEFKRVKRHTQHQPRVVSEKNAARTTVPTTEPPSKHTPARKFSRRNLIGAACIALLSIAAVGTFVQRTVFTQKVVTSDTAPEIIENLEYQTVIPEGKTISNLGGWRRVSPTGQPPVYAYGDVIDGVAISVSQQPLPSKFIGDTDRQVAELAKAYSAETVLNANGTKAYLGTSTKGPQSVIFSKNNLLILIKSQKKIENDAWTAYIKTLN